jgi:exonuclease SbcC
MIIRSIRLQNIKSYGEGPECTGIVVGFEPGVNRVAGRNGHGKTTLIESLGYALFLSEPRFEESFRLERYLLRHGAKAGEIDITFEHAGTTYRVERGIGTASKRRSKVIDCADQSICAEGDAEVGQFLSKILGLPQPEQLAEIFSKLIGVKQGRLTWPFDSKPSEAKRFFEPLFDVAVFRDCFDKLKPAVDAFQIQSQVHQRDLAVEQQKITEREASLQQLTEAQQVVAELEKIQATAIQARDTAKQEKEKHELFEKALAAAKSAQERAALALSAAQTRRSDAEVQVKAAETAAVTLRESEPAHSAFLKAESALVELEQQREKRDALRKQRDAAESDRKDRAAKAEAAREQAETFTKQREEKDAQAKALAAQIEPLSAKLASTKTTFDQAQKAATTATQDRAVVQAWINGIGPIVVKLAGLAAEIAANTKEIAGWDAAALVAAKGTEQTAGATLKALEADLAKARGLRVSLQQQLKDISGGLCPFLRESCRQFDPAKVQSDLDAQAAVIQALDKKVTQASAAHTEAKRQLKALEAAETKIGAKREQQARDVAKYLSDCRSVVPADVTEAYVRLRAWEPGLYNAATPPAVPSGAVDSDALNLLQTNLEQFKVMACARWRDDDAAIAIRLAAAEKEKEERQSDQNTLDHLSRQAVALKKEVTTLGKNAATKSTEAQRLAAEMTTLAKQVGAIDEQLKDFSGVDAQLTTQRQHRDANRAGHERYLQAKPVADDLASRRQRLQEREAEAQSAAKAAETAATALAEAQNGFDAGKLAAAKIDFQQKHDAVTAIETNLKHARAALPQAEKRVEEWRKACAERDRLVTELARLEAAIELTELARRTLQKAAPAVAQHLCDRIAAQAQALFNQISPDPVQLTWDAERYSLTIAPGDRRFAMLSGGEQTKLALALTLAMIEEFGGLRFCIFDEPTYGVDAESRQKLADAILSVQEAAGLDQLLLVSHDDAFEGKAEHTVLLSKSASSGSAVASFS